MLDSLNWLDIAALVIIAVCSIEGLLKGFVLSVFNMAGFIAAIIIAKAATSGLSGYITSNTGIDDAISKYFAENYTSIGSNISPVLKIFGDGKLGFENVLTSAVINVLSFILIFAAVKIILGIAASVLDTAARLPVIRQFNRLGGLVFGAFKGALILYIAFAVITLVIPLLSPTNIIVTSLGKSVFASNFYTYNFIIPFIKGKLFS